MKPTAPLRYNFSVFATTPWISSKYPAYAPASASILFPAFRFLAERRDSLVRFASSRSRTPAVMLSNASRGLSLSR
jgi:hypothetical protein